MVSTDSTLLVASQNGIGKRTPFEDYRSQTRGGKGIITMKTTDKTGKVVGALVVGETDEVMLMTDDGQSVRIRAADVRQAGRNTQGVKLMNLKSGVHIQDIARVAKDEDEEEGESENDESAGDGENTTSADDDVAGDSAADPPEE